MRYLGGGDAGLSGALGGSSGCAADAPRRPRARCCELACASGRMLVCRAGGALYALDDRCPHVWRLARRAGGCAGFALECPLHGGRLDVRDGRPVELPIRRAAACFAVREVRERPGDRATGGAGD